MDCFWETLREVKPSHARADVVLVNQEEQNCYHKKQLPIKVSCHLMNLFIQGVYTKNLAKYIKAPTLVLGCDRYVRFSVKKHVCSPHVLQFPVSPVNDVHHKIIGLSDFSSELNQPQWT